MIKIPDEYFDIFGNDEIINLKERIAALSNDSSNDLINDLLCEYGTMIVDKTLNINSN